MLKNKKIKKKQGRTL